MELDAPRLRILPAIALLLALGCLTLATPSSSTSIADTRISSPIGNGS
ncbi:MAG: hypothetical protein AAF657_16990 [Acidobacteriota bacterium]